METSQELHKFVLVLYKNILYWWGFIGICNKYLKITIIIEIYINWKIP